MKRPKFLEMRRAEALIFIICFTFIFGYIAHKMGTSHLISTMMNTSYKLLMDTAFYIMSITILSGAFGKLLIEFGVVRLIEKILEPLMKPLYHLPGVASLGALMTFLSDNPAIISLSKDNNFSKYFKKYQLVSLTNFGTAFGMGLVVIAFMTGIGYGKASLIGFFGAVVGSVISTRFMQYLVIRKYPAFKNEEVNNNGNESKISFKSEGGFFLRFTDALLDGGKSGVTLGLEVIPGILLVSSFVMILTFGPGESGQYTGAAYEGVGLLPALAAKANGAFFFLFGFSNPELTAFPITALGAVGAALGLVPKMQAEGLIDGNAIAVFTAMGMCWSGYLSTHTAMLDSLGYRGLTSRAIAAHTVGGIAAGISAHWLYVLVSMFITL